VPFEIPEAVIEVDPKHNAMNGPDFSALGMESNFIFPKTD